MDANQKTDAPTLRAGRPDTLVKAALYGLLILGIYYSAFSWLVRKDWARADFTYGYLIPAIVLYLVWEKRGELAGHPSVPSWKGLIPLGVGLLLFWLGELAGEFFTLYISMWLVVVGLCWSHLGWPKMKTLAFPLLIMLTMFPLPNLLYGKVSLKLKLVSSQLGVAMMQVYGMSVYREGNVIDLGFTQLQVVDACSGLRYLIPLFVLGILLAYLFRAALWKRVIVVLSAVALSIITNSLRIALTGILYEVWGARVAEGFFHGFSGWFIFMFSLAALLGLMWLLSKIPRRKVVAAREGLKGQEHRGDYLAHPPAHPVHRNRFTPHPDLLPSRGEGIENRHTPKGRKGEKRGFAFALVRPPQFLVAVLLLGSTLAFSWGIEFRERIPIIESLSNFPLQIGEWIGVRDTMDQRFIERLDLTDHTIIDYRGGAGNEVNLYVAYYESQRKGESIHSPATCLPGGGWTFHEAGNVTLPVSGYAEGTMKVNRALMEKVGSRQLVYYWFLQRGRVLTNAYELKWFVFWDALTKQRTDGALVRVITPVYETEGLEEAEARLEGFTREVVPVLDGFVPGEEVDEITPHPNLLPSRGDGNQGAEGFPLSRE